VFGLPLTLVGRFGIQVRSFLVEPFRAWVEIRNSPVKFAAEQRAAASKSAAEKKD